MLEVQLFFDEDDRYEGKPLHQHVLRYLMHEKIAGASLFAALMGYGVKHRLHEPRRLSGSDEGPLLLVFIDEEDRVRAVLPYLKEVVREGLIVVRTVERA
jgi:PII-like signaling protein